jgi:tRNA (guanine9-N1)-methyltransferase
MHVTSLNKRLLARYEGTLQNQHLKWKGMSFSNDPYLVTPEEKESLVYLTADSTNTIHELEPGKKYIIGGIVDRNRYKGLCFKKAEKQGIAHGRLPIGKHIRMASRQVLTTNQVVEIMLEWLKERDWKKAFVKVIPHRKMWKLKGKEEGSDEGEGRGDEAGDEGEEKGDEAGDENVKVEEGDVMVKAEDMDVDPSESTGVLPP